MASKCARSLPLTKGKYTPGSIDWMSGYGKDSTFVRLIYPTDQQNDPSRWEYWSPHENYINGFASLVNLWGSVIKAVVWFYGGEPKVPVLWLVPPHPTQKMPVVIFSHGFGATRFISSTITAELASQGFFVASIEHKETSACATYYYESEENLKNDSKTWIEHIKMKFGPNHYEIRNSQLNRRLAEIKKLLDLIEDLNKGKVKNILPSSVDLSDFKGKLDLSNVCMMGHSFGGATTLLSIANDPRITCGVVLDGWMYPLKNENLIIDKPLIFINTQTFHIRSNLASMQSIIDDGKALREVYTIKHTTHETQTDTPHILGYWLNWFMQKLDPKTGTDINNALVLNFLSKHTGTPQIPVDAEARRKYLDERADDVIEGTYLYPPNAKL